MNRRRFFGWLAGAAAMAAGLVGLPRQKTADLSREESTSPEVEKYYYSVSFRADGSHVIRRCYF